MSNAIFCHNRSSNIPRHIPFQYLIIDKCVKAYTMCDRKTTRSKLEDKLLERKYLRNQNWWFK